MSNESSKYYASLVSLTRFTSCSACPRVRRACTCCFAFHRFRQINDNLIEAFIHLVDQYEKQSKYAAEAAMQQALIDASEHLQAAGEVLRLFIDKTIADDSPFATVQKKAFELLEPERFAAVADYLRNVAFDKTAFQWSYYTTLSHRFKRNLRQLLRIGLCRSVEDAPLLDAVTFLQELLRAGKSPRQTQPALFPTAMIPKGLQRHLFAKTDGAGDTKEDDKRLEVDRYEFLVYRLLRNALEAGDLFVKGSNAFCRFEDDLISDARWEQRETVLQEIGAPLLLAPIEDTLSTFREALEARFSQVNQRITDSANKHIKLTGRAERRRYLNRSTRQRRNPSVARSTASCLAPALPIC
ncbi:hypothetical protein [Rhodanobacter lindaniclasticus]